MQKFLAITTILNIPCNTQKAIFSTVNVPICETRLKRRPGMMLGELFKPCDVTEAGGATLDLCVLEGTRHHQRGGVASQRQRA